MAPTLTRSWAMVNGLGDAMRTGAGRRGTTRRMAGWPLALLASTALVAVPSALVSFGFGAVAIADGGKGGTGASSGGAGGADNQTGAGSHGKGVNYVVGGGPGGGGGGIADPNPSPRSGRSAASG